MLAVAPGALDSAFAASLSVPREKDEARLSTSRDNRRNRGGNVRVDEGVTAICNRVDGNRSFVIRANYYTLFFTAENLLSVYYLT